MRIKSEIGCSESFPSIEYVAALVQAFAQKGKTRLALEVLAIRNRALWTAGGMLIRERANRTQDRV